jgi:hypothetical protein
VLDPEARDAADGPRGCVRITVPIGWAVEGATVRVPIPRRITCARCDGGGCDGCERSGAHKRPDAKALDVELELPAGSEDGVALRLAHPFGERGPVDQLLVEVRVSDEASGGVTRVPSLVPPPARRATAGITAVLVVALMALIVILLTKL